MSKIVCCTRMFIILACSRLKSLFMLALEQYPCYHSRTVRRAVHILTAVVAIVLVLRPLDCFGAGMTREAAECCLKGKCGSALSNDDCCKGTVADNTLSPALGVKAAADQHLTAFAGLIPEFRYSIPGHSWGMVSVRAHSPPMLASPSSHNLPLLI